MSESSQGAAESAQGAGCPWASAAAPPASALAAGESRRGGVSRGRASGAAPETVTRKGARPVGGCAEPDAASEPEAPVSVAERSWANARRRSSSVASVGVPNSAGDDSTAGELERGDAAGVCGKPSPLSCSINASARERAARTAAERRLTLSARSWAAASRCACCSWRSRSSLCCSSSRLEASP